MKKKITKLVCTLLALGISLPYVPSGPVGFIPALSQSVQAATTNEINITESGGGLEAAYVEWNPSSTSGVTGYTVSYAKSGSQSYTVIDDKLIRHYQDGHWRADIVGLSSGSYTLKVEAAGANKSETASVSVQAHDRRGFAFMTNTSYSFDGAPGAYKADGTPESGAQILYITSASDVDSVAVDSYTGLSTILQNTSKINKPIIVRIVGKIDYSGSQLNGSGYIQVKPSKNYTDCNVTIEGIGEDACVNFGFLLRNAGGAEIRNLMIHDFKDDAISLDTANCHCWIHNNDVFYGVQGSGDKAKGDGATDVKNDSQYITISYNHYWDGGKVSLCGMKSESSDNFITYHHNHFDHSDSRHPRIRTMSVHVFNNYYDGNAKYGVGASEGSSAFVESNYFRAPKYPTLQGSVGCDSDGKGGSNTLDDDNPIGAIKFYNNTIVDRKDGNKWTTDTPGTTNGNGDACLASTRSGAISYTTAAGATYNNFDSGSSNEAKYIQSITPDTPEVAKTNVESYAGRMGDDFKAATGFAFNNSVDDTSYDINTDLRDAITDYYENEVSSAYIIASVGGAVDSSFEPVTSEATTEATTKSADPVVQTTTEAQIETTTQATDEPSSDEIKLSYNKGYTFTGNGYLTSNNTYGGAYGAVSGSQSDGDNYVKIANNTAIVTDTDGSATTELYLPFDKTYTSGKITISGTFTPSVTTTNWTLLQIQGAGLPITGIRINGNKYYALRVNEDNTNVLSTGVSTEAGSPVTYKIEIDLNNKTSKLTLNNDSTTTVEGTFANAYVDTVKFVTASKGARNITVGNITVSTEGTTALQGDINGDGSVNSVDVFLGLRYLIGEYQLTSEQIARGDMDGDGSLALADVYKIKESI
ncbi:MAG: hypothetical protein IJS61_01600 [Firmicutes bacterium]|nr:hypothetical protein [Bacillota bacterium]